MFLDRIKWVFLTLYLLTSMRKYLTIYIISKFNKTNFDKGIDFVVALMYNKSVQWQQYGNKKSDRP